MQSLIDKIERENPLSTDMEENWRYVWPRRWALLNAMVENFNSSLRQPTKQGSEPTEICPMCSGSGHRDKSRNGNLEYGTCEKCGGSGKLLPC